MDYKITASWNNFKSSSSANVAFLLSTYVKINFRMPIILSRNEMIY